MESERCPHRGPGMIAALDLAVLPGALEKRDMRFASPWGEEGQMGSPAGCRRLRGIRQRSFVRRDWGRYGVWNVPVVLPHAWRKEVPSATWTGRFPVVEAPYTPLMLECSGNVWQGARKVVYALGVRELSPLCMERCFCYQRWWVHDLRNIPNLRKTFPTMRGCWCGPRRPTPCLRQLLYGSRTNLTRSSIGRAWHSTMPVNNHVGQGASPVLIPRRLSTRSTSAEMFACGALPASLPTTSSPNAGMRPQVIVRTISGAS